MIYVLALIMAGGIFIFFRALASAPREDLLETRLSQFRDQSVTLEEIELQQPFSERFLRPGMERIGAFMNSRVGRERVSNVGNKLSLAGRPGNLTVNGFISLKLVAGIIFGVLGFLLFNLTGLTVPVLPDFIGRIVAAFLVGLVGYIFPELWLRQKVQARQKEIRLALPNALDLLTISVEAGLGFDAALVRVTEKYKNALAEEFTQVLNEVRLGRPRLEALDDMGRRVGVEELHSFIQALIQSEQLGVGIAKVLRIQSEEMRRKRRQRAEEQAAQASLKMLFPMIGCIFPTIFIVLMGPGCPDRSRTEVVPSLIEADSGKVIVPELEIARTSWARFVGLMGRSELAPGRALWIEPCNSIHMFFMRFAIDVLFLDREGRVKRVLLKLRPWRISPIVFGSRTVVELPAGTLGDKALVGRRLRLDA